MLKKCMLVIAGLLMSMGIAFAAVDVNTADQAALDGVKGIGPKIAKSIVDERTKNGRYKDWADFEQRVKGVGDKSAAKMSAAGLTVNGQTKPGAPAATASKSTASPSSGSSASGSSAAGGESKGGSKRSSKKSSDSAGNAAGAGK